MKLSLESRLQHQDLGRWTHTANILQVLIATSSQKFAMFKDRQKFNSLHKAVFGIVCGPCEVNSYCKADILQVLIVTSSPFTSQSSRLGRTKRELKYLNFHVLLMAKSLMPTLLVLISNYVYQSTKCLTFFLQDDVSTFPTVLGESS